MQLKKNYENLREDESLEITATDQAFGKDVSSWCKITGAELVSLENKGGTIAATVRKKKAECKIATGGNSADNKTLIVFSDDLDKALASFVIANGAASTDYQIYLSFICCIQTCKHFFHIIALFIILMGKTCRIKRYLRQDVWLDASGK